jgi:hypothetical protein
MRLGARAAVFKQSVSNLIVKGIHRVDAEEIWLHIRIRSPRCGKRALEKFDGLWLCQEHLVELHHGFFQLARQTF